MTKKTILDFNKSVLDIDFNSWHRQDDIDTVLFDIEGTLTEWADPAVDPKIIKKLDQIRTIGISKIGLVTNINPKYHQRVAQVAKQIDVEVYRFPASLFERKPSGKMILKCIDELGSTADKCGFVGDKLFDVLAAKNAKVKRVAWVSRHGKADQWFDRYVYRLIEPVIKRLFA